MATVATYVGTPKVGLVSAVNADGTTAKTIVTAGSSGSKIVSLQVTSNDTSARTFIISIVRSAAIFIQGTFTIALASGTDGSAPSIDILGNTTLFPGLPVDNDGQRYMLLQSGDTLTATLTTSAVTAAKTVSFTAHYGDF